MRSGGELFHRDERIPDSFETTHTKVVAVTTNDDYHIIQIVCRRLLLAEDRSVKAFDVGWLDALAVATEVEGDRVVGPDK